MSASDDELREESRGRLPNVIRMAAGIAANPSTEYASLTESEVAALALSMVLACERVCGIGDTGVSDD